jgi:hypothetical protein
MGLHQVAPALDPRKYQSASLRTLSVEAREFNNISAQFREDREQLGLLEEYAHCPSSVLALATIYSYCLQWRCIIWTFITEQYETGSIGLLEIGVEVEGMRGVHPTLCLGSFASQ